MGLLSSLKEGIQNVQQQANEINEAKRLRAEEVAKIKVSTSSVCKKFEVIECIWGFEVSEEGWFTNASQGKAFTKVLRDLQEKCFDLGGHAVINCQFDYRYLDIKGKLRVEVYAYGTVIVYTE